MHRKITFVRMSPLQRTILALVLFYLFSANDFQVGGALSAKARRAQTTRLLTTRNNLDVQRAGSTSSLNGAADSRSTASTASGGRIDSTSFKEIDLQPADRARHSSLLQSIDLGEASMGVNTENFDPARDGVFARVRKAMLRYGAAAAIGSAVGVGGLEVKRQLFPDSSNNTEKYQSVVENTTDDSHGIFNPL